MNEGKYSTTPLTVIITQDLWNTHDRVRGVSPKDSKYLEDQSLKLQTGIDIELGTHTEELILDSEILGKCGVLLFQLVTEIEAFHLHFVTTTYGDAISGSRKYEFYLVVLNMVRVIWRELRKVRFQA